MLVIWHQKLSKAGLHNSETSEGQIMNINLPRASKVYFISMWGFRCKIWKKYSGYLFEVKLLQTLSTIEKALAGRKKSFGGPCVVQARVLCRPCVVQAVCCAEALSSKDSSQKWAKTKAPHEQSIASVQQLVVSRLFLAMSFLGRSVAS